MIDDHFMDSKLQILDNKKNLESHEEICAERYGGIIKSLTQGNERFEKMETKITELGLQIDKKIDGVKEDSDRKLETIQKHFDQKFKWLAIALGANLLATFLGPGFAAQFLQSILKIG